jgi:uncharacterized repeat protein (TIGR01451 family)
VSCTLGNLASGASANVYVTVTPTTTGSKANTATVASAEPDPDTANNSSTATTTVVPAADLSVSITGTPNPVAAGSAIAYTITLGNAGPSTAASPSVTFPLPASTTFQAVVAPAGWSCTTPAVGGGGTVTCSAASLAASASVAFSVDVRVSLGATPNQTLVATVDVATTTAETTLSNNEASTRTTVTAAAALLTRATLAGLRVDPSGLVEFATGSQRGTKSFDLYATDDPTGAVLQEQLNSAPIVTPRPFSAAPIVYSVRTAPVARRYVVIEETELRGRRRAMGPFVVGDAALSAAFDEIAARAGAEPAQPIGASATARLLGGREGRRERSHVGDAGRRRRWVRGAKGVRIATRGRGHVSVARRDLEAAGLPPSVGLERVRLYGMGRPVELTLGPDAIGFFAEPLSTTYTGDNAYVLTWSGRPATPEVEPSLPEPAAAEGLVRIAKRFTYVPSAPREIDPWLWDILVGDGSAWPDPRYMWDPEIHLFDIPGLAAGSPASVPVRVAVWPMTPGRHRVTASVNGRELGSLELTGTQPGVLEGALPASALLETANSLSLSYASTDTENGEPGLLFLRHLEIGAPLDRGSLRASVVGLTAYDPALGSLNDADYLIVTHGLFATEAERLAQAKRGEGRRVAVVDVARAYDRFSAGVEDAEAVAALIAHAARRGSLRDVLLFGDDTFDNQDFVHTGARSFVPSRLGWDGDFGRVPSENRYADLDGDGAPDVAIGRLPAQTVEEARVLVDKLARQSRALAALGRRHLFVTDNQAPHESSFRAEALTVAARFPAAASAWADAAAGTEAARAALFSGLAQGPLAVHYFGHGGPQRWADEGLLDGADAARVSSPGSVFFMWACEAQFFTYLWGRSLGEELLLNPDGGAFASFGPAGVTGSAQQAALYQALYSELAGGQVSLGEAVRRAKADAIARDPELRAVVEGFNLLGDPSLRLGDLGAPPAASAGEP